MDAKAYYPGIGDQFYSSASETKDPRNNQWHFGGKPNQPVMEALGINPMKVFSLPRHVLKDKIYIVPSGIGDIAWIYAKLLNLNEPLVFCVAGQVNHPVHSAIALRAFPFLDLLPNVKYSSLALCSSEQVYWATVGMDFSNCHMPSTPGYIACNRWLETGKSLDSFLPNLKTTRHFEMKRPKWAIKEASYFMDKDKEYFAIYPSSKDYFGDQNVALSGWIKMAMKMLKVNSNHNLILIGAPWDLTMLQPLYDSICALGYADRVSMVHDREFATSLEILRCCSFFIGAVSGLTIVAEYQRIPTVHVYPKQLYDIDNLMGTWESPEMKRQGLSLSLKSSDDPEFNIKRIMEEFEPLCQKF